MSWSDVHARYAVLDDVVARAATDPATAIIDALAAHDDAYRLFDGPAGIHAALQARWTNHLNAKLDLALEQGMDPVWAYFQLTNEQPRLRAVLDSALVLAA